MSTPSPGFVISIFHIKESSIPPSLPSSQAITAKDGEIICVWSIIGWLSLWKHVWDCFRMRGYDAQIFPGFLHSGFGGPDTSKYVWVLQATAVLFGCLFLWHSHSVLFSNTDFHAYVHVWQHCKPSHFFRANEPWWLELTVLWVWSWISAHTKGVQYWQKCIFIFWDFVDSKISSNCRWLFFVFVFLHWFRLV